MFVSNNTIFGAFVIKLWTNIFLQIPWPISLCLGCTCVSKCIWRYRPLRNSFNHVIGILRTEVFGHAVAQSLTAAVRTAKNCSPNFVWGRKIGDTRKKVSIIMIKLCYVPSSVTEKFWQDKSCKQVILQWNTSDPDLCFVFGLETRLKMSDCASAIPSTYWLPKINNISAFFNMLTPSTPSGLCIQCFLQVFPRCHGAAICCHWTHHAFPGYVN